MCGQPSKRITSSSVSRMPSQTMFNEILAPSPKSSKSLACNRAEPKQYAAFTKAKWLCRARPNTDDSSRAVFWIGSATFLVRVWYCSQAIVSIKNPSRRIWAGICLAKMEFRDVNCEVVVAVGGSKPECMPMQLLGQLVRNR